MPKKISILGATGSVGQSTLKFIGTHPEQFELDTVVANQNVAALIDICRQFNPSHVVVANEELQGDLEAAVGGLGISVSSGRAAVLEAAQRDVDILVSAVVGSAGLEPTLAALRAGNQVALANKESLVCAGRLVCSAAQKAGKPLLPLDSEHNALFQVFETHNVKAIDKVIITASGGAFRQNSREEMKLATPAQALRHPNWSMGQRITIDSATLMNKAFEVIECRHLFPVSPEQIGVWVHPQSLVHGLVQYNDGSLLAHMGPADMQVPIAHCLSYPERLRVNVQPLDLTEISALTFEKPDLERFPSMRLVGEVMALGDAAGTVFNAADEVAVEAFLKGQIGFLDIVETVEHCLEIFNQQGELGGELDLEGVLALDARTRICAHERIVKLQQVA
ncbi:1-deoxy-D-xylulose-5-phosphate reductoisomerase [Polycladidibacter stylochi]|uniref:1-deoxy-D-xylulose-5-phosphate reductoisomerase n=1 Tax=Polycladidibacter stylochi TaxID=1807766 RepID=UPI000834F174|nr:1-deoxy-D-xylulose-5-phosphate reductoisomerase [Pseudovibrio stylochi]